MEWLKRHIGDWPTANTQILTALFLAIVVIVAPVVLAYLVRPVPDAALDNARQLVQFMLGAAVLSYVGKRATYKPSPPATPDVEDQPKEG